MAVGQNISNFDDDGGRWDNGDGTVCGGNGMGVVMVELMVKEGVMVVMV